MSTATGWDSERSKRMDAVQIGFLVVMVGLVVMETVLGGGLSRPRE